MSRKHGHECNDCHNAQLLQALHASLPPSPPPSSPPPLSMFGRPSGCIDQLTTVERAAIITLHGIGWTGRDIAQELHCSEQTVSLWLTRWNETRSLEDSERSGRPRCTTDEADQQIGLLSDQKTTSTPRDIQRELRLPVSLDTIDRRLTEIGLFGRVQEAEYDLSEFDLQRRLAFANEYKDRSEDWWADVMFSDETSFPLQYHPRIYVRRPPGMAHDPKYMRQEQRLEGKVSLWGCICAKGLGHAELYEGALNSVRHRDILRHNLISSFREFSPRGPWIFQQDNARFHTTPETISYLHGLGITWLEWPAWSPDLNPIENFWSELKARVYSRFPQTMEELEQFIREEWDATGLTYINKLCRSMPRRLQLLLENEGHKIAY